MYFLHKCEWLRRVTLLLVCLLAGLGGLGPLGCRKAQMAPGKYVTEVSRTLESLKPDDVLVAVNGVTLTRGEFELLLAGMEKNLQAQRPNINPQTKAALYKNWRNSLIAEFVGKELMVQEARRRGLKVTPEEWERTKAGVLAPLARHRNVEVEALADAMETDIRAFYAMAQDNALVHTLRRAEFGDRLVVTDEDFAFARAKIDEYNEICAQTNALVMAQAQAIIKRLKDGEDFTQVATETTQDEEHPDGAWGSFARVEIDDDGVAEAAFRLPLGGVSEPLLTDEGLLIIKVLAREGADSPMALDPAEVTLARIVLWWADEYPLESDQVLRKRLERERLKELELAFLRSLQAKARLEYPNGTNFFQRAAKPKRPRGVR